MGWRGIKFKRKECFCWESNHTTNKTKPTQTSITNCRSAHRWDIHCSFHDINKNLHCVTWRCQVWCAEILQQRPCCWVQVSPRVLTSLKPQSRVDSQNVGLQHCNHLLDPVCYFLYYRQQKTAPNVEKTLLAAYQIFHGISGDRIIYVHRENQGRTRSVPSATHC